MPLVDNKNSLFATSPPEQKEIYEGTIDRQNIESLLGVILGNLNKFLGYTNFKILDRRAAQEGYMALYDDKVYHRNYNLAPYGENFIAISDDDKGCCRNGTLLAKRISNIHKIKTTLTGKLGSFREHENDASYCSQVSKEIYDILINGLNENACLSAEYKKQHRSFRENRLLGMGFFSAWLNRSFTQSRAQVALEKSLDELKKFSEKYIENAPPSYFSNT